MVDFSQSPITAVLGPTNTGKTHLAVERLCGHSSGMIGFPLRLLAREVYDRVVKIKGESQVALITGEEKIIPQHARWFLCTAESMPLERDLAFVALDEAQLGADAERGHVFTDRLLRARGREETMILGSDTLRPMVRELLPEAEIISRPRFSTLSYGGVKKLSRLPKRSAIVAFSAEEVYAVAEMLRRLRGGSAVVMGALSPRTRNAQVEMFQAGEVDYLVATDAIGMGLNMDVTHVAFASLRKFDGRRRRRLNLTEIAQIAGRAGRHQRDGTFGTLSSADGSDNVLTPEEIERVENHDFPPLKHLYWRDSEPRFDSLGHLIADLEAPLHDTHLRSAPESIDLAVLKKLAENPEVTDRIKGKPMIKRLWAAASLPDFRKVGADHHARFVARLWNHLSDGNGFLPHGFVASEVARLDNVQGDVEAISGRIAAIRTWAYIAHRADWLADPAEIAGRTHALEEKLSDALHNGLTQRFVDRRTTILLRGLGENMAALPVEVEGDGEVLVDGEYIGQLDGFQFKVSSEARMADKKMLLAAAERHLGGIMSEKADQVANADDQEFTCRANDKGMPVIIWQDAELGALTKGKLLTKPIIVPHKSLDALGHADLQQVVERAGVWLNTQVEKHLAGLLTLEKLSSDAETPASLRALFAQLFAAGGIENRLVLQPSLKNIDKDHRGLARKAGITFGALDIFHFQLIKPMACFWRAAMFAVREGSAMDQMPPDNAVHLADWKFESEAHARNCGYRAFGNEYVRVDMAEKLIKQAHEARKSGDIFEVSNELATSLGLAKKIHFRLLRDAGFKSVGNAEEGEAQKWHWGGMKKPRKPQGTKPKPTTPASNAFAGLADLVAKGS